MKKTLIILLSLILVFSFSSCSSDKSEEAVALLEEFSKAYKLSRDIRLIKGEAGELTTQYYNGSSSSFVEDLDCHLNDREGNLYSIGTITSASGSVKNTEGFTSGTHLTYENIVFVYPYKYDGKDESGRIEFSGTYSSDKAKDGTITVSVDYTINGVRYNAEYSSKDNAFTSVSVGGKSVNVRLANAANGFAII